MSRASAARRARMAQQDPHAAVINVRTAAGEFLRAFAALTATIEALPCPVGASEQEHNAFVAEARAFRIDFVQLTEMLSQTIEAHVRRGLS